MHGRRPPSALAPAHPPKCLSHANAQPCLLPLALSRAPPLPPPSSSSLCLQPSTAPPASNPFLYPLQARPSSAGQRANGSQSSCRAWPWSPPCQSSTTAALRPPPHPHPQAPKRRCVRLLCAAPALPCLALKWQPAARWVARWRRRPAHSMRRQCMRVCGAPAHPCSPQGQRTCVAAQ